MALNRLKLPGSKMPWLDYSSPVVAIIGPTAVGKSSLAIELARHYKGEIVSADSRQFYRGMDIGTAKPGLEELDSVPHHLINILDPDQPWSLAEFKRAAQVALADIHFRGKLAFLVGGTGQYVYGLLEDWQIPRQAPDTSLRETLETWGRTIGPAELHRRLAILDPEAAGMIQPQNLRRTVRALEVILHTGRKFSEQRRTGQLHYSVIKIGLSLPRPELYDRVDARIETMLANGLVEEVMQLRSLGYSSQLPTMSAIGYREINAYLDGILTLEEAVERMKRQTRAYIRRQANWFKRNDPAIHWLQAGNHAFSEAIRLIERDENWILPGNESIG